MTNDKECMYGCKYSNWKWNCKFFTNISDADRYAFSENPAVTKLIPVSCKYEPLLPVFIKTLKLHCKLVIPIKIN